MNKTISTILIDDELPNLIGLEQKLNKHFPELEIIDKCQNPEDAIIAVKKLKPKLLFLDIQMPRINGFELLSELESLNFNVIFVTAYSEYAIKAFKKSAIDYVLKPIDDNDLKIAVEKAITAIDNQDFETKQNNLLELLSNSVSKNDKLIVPTAKGLSFIPQTEILHLEGYQGYTKICLDRNTTIISSYNIGKFEKMLSDNFFKCHKSHIINLQKVRHFENEGYLVLENDKRIPISRSNKKKFIDSFLH